MDLGSGDFTWLDSECLEANRRESRALRQTSEQTRARARETRHHVRVARSQRKARGEPTSAWLLARLGTMPVIEQAKGIVMAQQRCGPDEAFDLLRRMSQRTNVKLHVLAAHIVEHIACADDHDNVTPISLGATRHLGSRTAGMPARWA